jgi:GNAT superfamily N-acetyltransferase
MDDQDLGGLDLSGEFISLLFDEWKGFGLCEEPDMYCRPYVGRVAIYDGIELDVPIGMFEAVFIDFEGAVTEGLDPFDVFDNSATTVGYFELLYDLGDAGIKASVMKIACGPDDYIWSPNLLIIQRLIIEPKFRGNGLGLAAMRALILNLRGGAGLVAIKPFPLQFEGGRDRRREEFVRLGYDTLSKNERAATAKLRRLYRKLGFKLVPKTPYMVLDVQDPMPSISELKGREFGPSKRHRDPTDPVEP